MVSKKMNPVVDSHYSDAFSELESSVQIALETYSNVHRGNGQFSMVTTHLFEQARDIVLEYLGLSRDKFMVIFCTPRSAAALLKKLSPESYQMVSSQDIGLSIGVRALAVKRNSLPKGAPFQTGGGTARLISKDWVIWAKDSDKFEAGTPAIVNITAFAKALRMLQQSGKDIFLNPPTEMLTANEILYNDELEKFSGQELLNELRKSLIGSGAQVPTMKGMVPFINLDNSASTPTFTPVWNAFRQTLRQPEQVRQEV
ncbi:aminotransferase class V-fold PLP-dependent enzyme, partial [bacterium]|nr:aminotransferase class V-fold PLP-dependent enzyme [bacterium]